VSRPRLAPEPEHVIRPEDAPELYRLIDEITHALRARRVATIGVNGDWNAGTYRSGLRQRTTILIGLPYWHALDPQERLALLGHEIRHTVNGDTTRSIVQVNADLMLRHWAAMTEPDRLLDDDGDFGALASLPANLVMLGCSLLVTGIAEGLFALAFPSRLRAELYADRLGASVAGRAAALSEQRMPYFRPAFERALAAVTVRRPPAADLFDEIRAQVAATPPSELERLRRRERLEPFAFDQTHPPTPEREAMLLHLPANRPPLIEVDEDRMRKIDAELDILRPAVTRELIEEYRAAVLG